MMEQQQGSILARDPSNGGASAMAFSPDGKRLAAAEWDGYVRVWNPVTGRPAGAPLPADPGGYVARVAFSPDGSLLATADGDGYVRVWNLATRRPVGARLFAGTGVTGMALSPDGTLLAAAYTNDYVRFWNLVTGQAVGAPLPAVPGPGDLAPGGVLGPHAVSFSAGTDADPYAALCADVGPPTHAEWAQYAPGEPQPNVCR